MRGAADNDFKLILPFPAWPLYWKHGKGYFPLFPFFCEICNRIREKCWKVCRKRGGEAELVKCLSQHISEVKRRKSWCWGSASKPRGCVGAMSTTISKGAAGTAGKHQWEIPQGAVTVLAVSVNDSRTGVLVAPLGSRCSTQPGWPLCQATVRAAGAQGPGWGVHGTPIQQHLPPFSSFSC